jgi:hypothetical protein
MKITLDPHCIVHLAGRTEAGSRIAQLVSRRDASCYVVNIACAPVRDRGVRPEHYEHFEGLLAIAGVGHLPRLDPLFVCDVTFWGKAVPASDEMARLAQGLGDALYGEAPGGEMPFEGPDSPAGRRWLDRHCEVQAMWCHIHNRNDVFLTTDTNLKRDALRPKLGAFGAGRVCLPGEV